MATSLRKRTREALEEDEVRHAAEVGYRVDSGVPLHPAVTTQLAEISGEIERLREQFQDFRDKLPDIICDAVLSKLRSRLQLRGAVTVTPLVSNSSISTSEERVIQTIQDVSTSSNRTPALPQQCHISGTEETQEWWRTFRWNDDLIDHFVPPNWHFPQRISVKTLWDLWLFGNRREGIRPYRLINRLHDLTKADRNGPHLRARKTMEFLLQRVWECTETHIRDITLSNGDDLFGRVYENALKELYSDVGTECKDIGNLSYGSFYNRLCSSSKSK